MKWFTVRVSEPVVSPDFSEVPPPLSWSDASRLDALEVAAHGLVEFSGFKVARIALIRGDYLECVAASGDPASVSAALGVRSPAEQVHQLLANAEDWGILQFIRQGDISEVTAHVRASEHPDLEVVDDEAHWQPLDVLFAPLFNRSGKLQGLVSFDRPRDGRRPGPHQRNLLERCAVQALRALLNELEYTELSDRARMAQTARRVVRTATTQTSLVNIVADCREALRHGYDARETWVHVFDDSLLEAPSTMLVGARDTTESVADVTERLSVEAWESQQVIRLTENDAVGTSLGAMDQEVVREFLISHGIGSLMMVPLGAAEGCLGALMLSRSPHDPPWSDVEASTALDLGHDLGRALLNLRTLKQREHLVARLRTIDTYKNELISTISHELRTPLTSILGNLEFLNVEDLTTREAEGALAAADRGAKRLIALVEDLLLLSRVGDPDAAHPFSPVDMRYVALAVRDLTAVSARDADQTVEVVMPDEPVLTLGDARQLDRAVVNLVTNALKYGSAGDTVILTVENAGDQITISCTDTGIGVSPEDQENLFREFFRSADPEARRRSGSGLGLAIVERIVNRHGGDIAVDSVLGEGSTFTMRLPAS